MASRFTGLWRNADFVRLWAGQTVSVFGSMIGGSALSFTAILALKATPIQMALLGVAQLLPGFLVGLVAGVWVDRLRRRPVMVAADLGRALLLASIPAAALLGLLRVEQLYLVAFLAGVLTLFFDVVYQSYLPTLVRSEQLVEGNSKLSASASVAEASGFSAAGWLVQLFTAPMAILIDALSFLASALLLTRIRTPEALPAPPEFREGFRREVSEGLAALRESPVLVRLTASSVLLELSTRVVGTVIVLFMVRDLGFSPGVLGLIWAVGGVTSLLGALAAAPAARRLGAGRTMVLSLVMVGLGSLFVPLATGPNLVGGLLLVANQLVTDPAWTLYDIHQVSLRQQIAPERLLGRVNASVRFLGMTANLVGAVVGGLLGGWIGLRTTIVVGSLGAMLAAVPLAASPVLLVREEARVPDETAPVVAGESD